MTATKSASLGELMQILQRESMLWRLRINTDDDLWSLARLARAGMSLGMLGERRDQTTAGEEGGRAKSAERKKMWIKLRIENTEYQSFSDVLRVHGIIEEAKFDTVVIIPTTSHQVMKSNYPVKPHFLQQITNYFSKQLMRPNRSKLPWPSLKMMRLSYFI